MNVEKMLLELLISQYKGGQTSQGTTPTAEPTTIPAPTTTPVPTHETVPTTATVTENTTVPKTESVPTPKWEFTEDMYNSINNTLVNLTNLIQSNNRNNPQKENNEFFV